jgi:3-hydroxyisobutyrate dehydrogenase
MASIGFIGLGHMGFPMMENLLKAGHHLYVFDLNSDALAQAKSLGAFPCASGLEAGRHRDFVFSMLPEGKHVQQVYLSESGLLHHLPQDSFLIECSTIDITTSQAIHTLAKAQGIRLLDAPVSGGVVGAKNATLTFMVGGNQKDFEAAKPLLQQMGKNIFHAGAATHGQAAKICNNLMLGIHMVGTSEAFNLAEKLGLAKEKLFEIACLSSGQSWTLVNYCPAPGLVPTAPANRDYQPGFTAQMMLKDLGLAVDAATATGTPIPLTTTAKQLYQDFCVQEGQLDFSAIIQYLKNLS